MILAGLAGLSLVVMVSTDTRTGFASDDHMSAPEKRAVVQNYITRATECVARKVAADARLEHLANPNDLGELIAESVPPCVELMRSMIERYDHYFGVGTGEAFFSGPYLDTLPAAVGKLVREERP